MTIILALLLGVLTVRSEECSDRTAGTGECETPRDEEADLCCWERTDGESGEVTCEAADDADTVCPVGCGDAYTIRWIGSSTQFNFEDPCSGNYIRVKVDRIYDAAGNKQTSLASTSNNVDKTDENPGTTTCYPDGADCDPDCDPSAENSNCGVMVTANELTSTLTKVGTGTTTFKLTAQLFRADYDLEVPHLDDNGDWEEDENGNKINDTVSIKRNELKFGFEIENWPVSEEITVVLDIKTKSSGTFEKNDEDDIENDEFYFKNDESSTCDNGNPTDVKADAVPNGGGNQMEITYTFEACQGTIKYDPILSMGGAGQIGVGLAMFVALIAALFN